MKLSHKIVYMRKKRGISQEQLAKKMNVSRQAVYKWEAGLNAPELDKIYKLAEIFNISYDLLLDEKIDLELYFSQNQEIQEESLVREEQEESLHITEKPRKNNKRLVIISLIIGIAIAVAVLVGVLIINHLNTEDEAKDTSTETSADINTNTDTDTDTNTNTDTDTDTDTGTDTDTDTSTDANTDTNTDTSTNTDINTPPTDIAPTKINITLVRGEENMSADKVISCNVGEAIGTLPSPQLVGHIFVGWFKKSDTEYANPITETTIVTNEMTELVPVHTVDRSNPPVIVLFDSNGGKMDENDESRFVVIGTRIGSLPNVDRSGYRLLGWYLDTDEYYLNEYTQGTIITGNVYEVITLKAIWKEKAFCVNGTEAHSWGQWKIAEEATCVKPRKDTHTCGQCGYEEAVYVKDSFSDHSFGAEKIVTIGDCVTATVYESTCQNCDEVKTREVPPSGHNYINGVCEKCEENEYTNGVIYTITGSEAYVSGYTGSDEVVKIRPSYTPEGSSTVYPVTNIRTLQSDTVRELVIPEGVESISYPNNEDGWACPNLKIIHIPTTLRSISTYTFKSCPIEKVYIKSLNQWCQIQSPESNMLISKEAFIIHSYYDMYLNNEPLTSLHLTSDIAYISPYAFAYCRSIKALTMDFCNVGADRAIERGAFYSCGIQTAEIKANGIGEKAFYMCRDLVSVNIIDAYGIGNNAFGMCYRIFEVYARPNMNLSPGDTSYGDAAKFAKVVNTSASEPHSITISSDGFVIGYANNNYYLIMYLGNQGELKLPRAIAGKSYIIGRYFILPECGKELKIEKILIPKEITIVEAMGLYVSSSLEILCEVDKKPSNWETIFGAQTTVLYSQALDY